MSELIKALVAARKDIGAAKKDSTNPHFKSKYADLGSVMEAVKGPLEAHGLAFCQDIKNGAVVTVILHESGLMLELAPFPIVATKPDAQGHGSALTYARRYSLQTALGVPAEDDDGNKASEPKKDEAKIISPVKESLNGVDVDRTKAKLVASLLLGFHRQKVDGKLVDTDGEDTSWKAWELYEPLDSDMRLAVWDELKTESKVRSWIKELGQTYSKATA